MEAADKANDHAWEAAYNRVQQNYKDMKANGMTVVTDVPGEFLDQLAKAGNEAVDQWVKKMGPDAEKILKEYRAKIEK
jgi:TRAP-type C4-dicarboxylate transport system substrate-binding protein